jgi:hypothetical protein
MQPTDDTHVPGMLIEATARVVGARRAAVFRVRDGAGGAQSLELYRCLPEGEAGAIGGGSVADAIRRFVVPCLADDRDAVFEATEGQGPVARCFVLVVLARDAIGVRGVALMEVGCHSRLEAERRMGALKGMMA